METSKEALSSIEEQLQKVMFDKAKTDFDIRQDELLVKKINAFTNLQKAKSEPVKLEHEKQRLEMEARQLRLNEFQVTYNITADMFKKADKIQRVIGKTMVGLFEEQVKQVVAIMKATKKLSILQE